MTLSNPGTNASPCTVYCVDRTITPPTVASLKTTATISTTGATFLQIAGSSYWYGIIFSGTSTTTSGNQSIWGGSNTWQVFEKCSIRSGANGDTDYMSIGNTSIPSYVEHRTAH